MTCSRRANYGAVPVIALALMAAAIHVGTTSAFAEEPPIPGMEAVTISEHLGETIDTSLRFRDETGKEVALSDYIRGDKPVILTLNYYRCPMLCNLQLNALTDGLRALEWAPGEEFRIVTVSIDHRETPELAVQKKKAQLASLGKGDQVDWHFLVGDERSIRTLADSVGFGFKFLPDKDEYAHVAALFVLSPDGMIARYLYGLSYPAMDLKFALIEAADGLVGSTVDKLLLSCFAYDHTEGAYGPFAFGIMRLGGGLTVLVLGFVLGLFWLRERRHRHRQEVEQG